MSTRVFFIYEKRMIQIQCTLEDKMEDIYQKFITKLNPSLSINDFDYFYEGNKLDKNIQNLNNSIFIDKNEVTISVEKKSKIVKCPQCICNDSIIDIDNYVIKFSNCKYNHVDYKIFDDYEETQKINYSKIFCKEAGCKKNQSNDYEDFYKCITCCKLLSHTQYYCNFHSKEHDKNLLEKHKQVKYEQKNYICSKHEHEFTKYCFTCRKDLCRDCYESHKGHKTKKYEQLCPNLEEFKESLNQIKTKIENLKIIIAYIKKNLLDGTMKIYKNYCEILNDVIEKYEYNNKELKNYNILKTFFNLKKSNKMIMDDLDKIINEKDYKQKTHLIIEKFQADLENYKSLNNNINNIEKKVDDLDDYKEWEEEIKKTKVKENGNNTDKKEKSGDTKKNLISGSQKK